jgi:hypothetical protein
MSNLPPLCHRHCRDHRTDRWDNRKWYNQRALKMRKVFVPDRQVDRYYIKWNYEKQPAAAGEKLRRYW